MIIAILWTILCSTTCEAMAWHQIVVPLGERSMLHRFASAISGRYQLEWHTEDHCSSQLLQKSNYTPASVIQTSGMAKASENSAQQPLESPHLRSHREFQQHFSWPWIFSWLLLTVSNSGLLSRHGRPSQHRWALDYLPWPWTLTYDLDLWTQPTNSLSSPISRSNVHFVQTVWTHRHTHWSDHSTWTTKPISNKQVDVTELTSREAVHQTEAGTCLGRLRADTIHRKSFKHLEVRCLHKHYIVLPTGVSRLETATHQHLSTLIITVYCYCYCYCYYYYIRLTAFFPGQPG